jgi:hypothetical protein
MLGNLFVIFMLGVILAIIIGTAGDDIENIWRLIKSRTDPEHKRLRQLRQHTRK